jgi:GT2 family glycosyltransferase
MKKIGIVIINYKNYAKKFLVECRDSIEDQDYPRDQFNVYIVDNASSEETRLYLEDHYSNAKIIVRNDGNYCAGNNAGARRAIEDGCELLVFVNMDVKLDKKWLGELVNGISSDSAVGAVQSKLLLYPKDGEKELKINTLGNLVNYLGFGYTSYYKKKDFQISGYPEIHGNISGCSYMITAQAFERIGGYYNELYMYHDDQDIGWKLKLNGYKMILAAKSIAYHKYEFDRSVKMVHYMERNRWMIVLMFYKLPTIILILPMFLVLEMAMIFYSILNGWFPQKLKALGYFCKISSWKKISKQRKFIESIRTKKDKEILRHFQGKVLFQEIENPVLKYIGNPLMDIYLKLVKIVIFW